MLNYVLFSVVHQVCGLLPPVLTTFALRCSSPTKAPGTNRNISKDVILEESIQLFLDTKSNVTPNYGTRFYYQTSLQKERLWNCYNSTQCQHHASTMPAPRPHIPGLAGRSNFGEHMPCLIYIKIIIILPWTCSNFNYIPT